MVSARFLRGVGIAVCAAVLFGFGALSLAESGRSDTDRTPRVKPKTGNWFGIAVDDKYGDTGAVEFKVRKRGRLLRHLRIDDIAGDCAGVRNDTLTVRLPRAKIDRDGTLEGHYVFADPGEPAGAVVSYFGKFKRKRLVGGRIYQDNDLDGGTESTCEVAAASFTARRAK